MSLVTFGSTAILFIVIGALLFFKWLTVNFNYFKNQGIPGPTPRPFIGTWTGFWKSKIHEVELKSYTKYGRLFGTFDGRKPNWVVGHPDLIRRILIADFDSFTNRRPLISNNVFLNKGLSALQDDEWKSVRGVMTPAFTSSKIKTMYPIMTECALSLVQMLTKTTSEGQTNGHEGSKVNIKSAVSVYVLDVIASCAFGTKIDPYQTGEPFVKTATKIFSASGSANPIFTLFYLYPQLTKIFIPAWMFKGLNFFAKLSQKIVDNRRSSTGEKEKRNDFLDLLLEAADIEVKGHPNPLTDDTTLVAQVILFLLAGFDTTSLTIALVLHFLAVNEEIQVKVRKEITNLGQTYVNTTIIDFLNELPYLEQCINETLRLCPPVTRFERICKKRVDYKEMSIHPGTIVTIPAMAIHLDPQNYPDPLTFDPERFSSENKRSRDPMTFLPFGAGQRQCIGMRFALAEIKLCLYHLISNFNFFKISETQDPPSFDGCSAFGLLQNRNIWIGIKQIQS